MVLCPTFVYRLDYLRWELRAIEFGFCDPANTGTASLDDCRRLLYGDRRSTVAKGDPPQYQRAGKAIVTWEFYQKDIRSREGVRRGDGGPAAHLGRDAARTRGDAARRGHS
ncbi:hypothetical protein LSCM1_02934 [Leishmania martiniquensis]|uniref:Uncharacterized protein n=1 Tax=Leishmania martiniquensis TaxID=1580590 RepID=A0A836H3Z1_9TRYP|nr:hypothetical protein LSCM1_02934 [Leishmania martiniquensis]